MATQLLLVALGLTALATSHPVANSSTSLDSRSDPPSYFGIYVCPGAYWRGGVACQWHVVHPEDRAGAGKCISFVQAGGFGSVGPDRGIELSIYLEEDCPEKSKVVGPKGTPGWADMGQYHRVDEHPLLWFIAKDV